ncbi:hypothetical protein P4S73_20840 [Paraglaciecola sp. Hal342]
MQNKLRDAELEQAQAMLGDKASLSDKGFKKCICRASFDELNEP